MDDLSGLVKDDWHWRHCIVVGPGSAHCWGLSPRFNDTTETYIDNLDDRSVPLANPAKVHATLDDSDATVAATSQVIYGALPSTCAASVIRHEAGKAIVNLAGGMLRSTGATSGGGGPRPRR